MSMEAGTLVNLEIAREVSPNGFFLTDGDEDVLLPYSEIVSEERVQVGDTVEVFLYFDTEDRITATMKTPLLILGEVGLLEVVDIHPRFGYFLEMGLGRHLLLPYKHVPEMEVLRPQVGDLLYVTLSHDRQGRLVARLAGEEELEQLCVRAPSTWKNTWVEARVYKPLQIGTFVLCDAGVLGFGVIGLIPSSERTRLLRVGEKVKVRVTFVREEDGRVNLSMRLPKELGRDEDSERILALLRERPNGGMPFSDMTPADVISDRLGMSKSAFKRAIGKLMKENKVVQKENWTYLLQDETPSE